MTTTPEPDLTPFGFTPTESSAYLALLDLGQATGYQVAKRIGVARANAYGALAGLLEKGAARLQTSDPKVYRATRPEDLIAELGRVSVARIDRLQGQFAALGTQGASSLHEFAGTREFVELAIRLAARDANVVRFLGSGATARSLTPVWRKRDQDGLKTTVIATSDPGDLPVSTVRTLDGPAAAPWSIDVPAILSASDASIVGVETLPT